MGFGVGPVAPLDLATEVLRQPLQEMADPLAFLEAQDEEETKRDFPQFFREMAQQLSQYQEVQQQQQVEAAQRRAIAEVQTQNAEAAQEAADDEQKRVDKYRDSVKDSFVASRVNDLLANRQGPVQEGVAAPFVTEHDGGFFGGLKDIAKSVTAPVGKVIEAGIEGIGAGIEHLPGGERVGTAVGSLPEAAAQFKRVFGQEFEKKTGQPLNLETSLDAINNYGFKPITEKVQEGTDFLLRYSADPVIDHTIGEISPEAADKIRGVTHFVGGLAPYALIAMLAPGLTTVGAAAKASRATALFGAMDTAFALSASSDIKQLATAYENGQIDGRTFLLGSALSAANILPPIAGRLGLHAFGRFKAKAEADKAIADIMRFRGKNPLEIADEMQKVGLTKSYDEMAGTGSAAVETPKVRTAAELEAARPPTEAPVEVPTRVITERPQTPVDQRVGRHRLETPEGDRLEWRETPSGGHIADVTVQVEREGRGSALLNKAIEDIRAQNPDASITADLNSEGGARLFAKQAGVQFTDTAGRPITSEAAIAAATRREGPQAEIPGRVPAPVEAPAPRPTPGRLLASEAGAMRVGKEGETGFDGVRRTPVQDNQWASVQRREDGTYDVFDKRWADPKTGVTAGIPVEDAVKHFDNVDDALSAAEDLAVRGAAPADVKRARFQEAAATEIEKGPRIVQRAEEELRAAQEPRPVREAAAIADAETRYRTIVDRTNTESGATVDPTTGDLVPYEGYFVGGGVPTKTIPLSEFTPQTLADFVSENADAFKDSRLKLGTEVIERDGEKAVNIDASIQMKNRGAALELARERGEERVWDTAANEAIDVSPKPQVKLEEPTTPEVVRPGTKLTGSEQEAAQRLRNFTKEWSEPERNLVERVITDTSDRARFIERAGTANSWLTKTGSTLERVLKKVKDIGRQLTSSELGALRLGRRADIEGMKHSDLIEYGAARRWLFPQETWKDWGNHMSTKVGGSADYWLSNTKRDVQEFVEEQMGLLGTGPRAGGLTKRTPEGIETSSKYGPATKPSTYETLKQFADEGAQLRSSGGGTLDMRTWYDKFYPWMKKTFGDDAEVVTMLAATTQANASPAGGVPGALRAYIQWRLGEPITGQMSASISKQMEQILRGGVPRGSKISPFYEALRYSGERGRNAVAIDRWMIAALGGQEARWKSLAGNDQFLRFAQTIIRSAASEANVSPRAFQAAVWGAFKKDWNQLRESVGLKSMSEDYTFFEDLFARKMTEFNMRAPKDMRLLGEQQQLFDVETLQREAVKVLGDAKPGETYQQRSNRLNELLYNDWNNRVAASHLLDTGEVPTHITDPVVRTDVESTANYFRRGFQDRLSMADDSILTDMSKKGRLPAWQKKMVDETLTTRKTGQTTVRRERFEALPKEERTRLRHLGWETVPQDAATLRRVTTELDNLRDISDVPSLSNWLHRNADIVGDPAQYIGRKLKTGTTYMDTEGKLVEKTTMAPYWERKSFHENTRILNIGRIKQEVLSRFPDQRSVDGTSQDLGQTLRRGKSELAKKREKPPLGSCAA